MRKILSATFLFLIFTINNVYGQGFLKNLKWVEFNVSNTCFYQDYTNPQQTSMLKDLCKEIKSDLVYELKMADLEVDEYYSEGRGGGFVYYVTIEKRNKDYFNYYGRLSFQQRVKDIEQENLTTLAITWQSLFNDVASTQYQAKKDVIKEFEEGIEDFLKKYFSHN